MTRRPPRTYLSLAAVLVAAGAACGPCGSKRAQAPAQPPAAAPPGASAPVPAPASVPTGIVEGVVTLAVGATLPSFPPPPAGAAGAMSERCSPPKLDDRVPVRSVDGGLVGVLVAADEFTAVVPHEPEEHSLVIRDCRLEPRFVAATVGDRMVVRNESPVPMLPSFGDSPFTQAILKDQDRTTPLEGVGHFALQCGFGGACGRTDVIVMRHPIRTSTGAAGRFRLARVPANENVLIHAWHPLFKDASVRVTVAAGETKTIALVLEPMPPSPPVSPPATEGPAENRPGLF